MRTFYIYNVKDFVYDIYCDYPYKLYKILEDAYLTSRYDIRVSSNYYTEVTNRFNKLFMNNYVIANHKLNGYYYRKDNIHVITNYQEYSKLMITSQCLKLKTSVNYPCFLDTINGFSESIFVCDFENQDYFWLNSIIKANKLLINQ